MSFYRTDKEFTAIIKGDVLFIGDICYALNKHDYYKYWGDKMNYENGIITNDKNDVLALVVSTAYGDGAYYSDSKDVYPVDAGVIGVVSNKYWREGPVSGGTKVSIPGEAEVTISSKNGDIYIQIFTRGKDSIIWQNTIYTGDNEGEEEEE